MENKLIRMFDYQKFDRNKDLQRVINQVDQKYDHGVELVSESALSFAVGGKKLDRAKTGDQKNSEDDLLNKNGNNLR